MSDWHTPPEFMADDLAFGIFDRKTLEKNAKAAPPAPAGFVPQRLKGAMITYEPRQPATIAKRREMDERADLIVSGVMTRREIADAYGVSLGSIKEQVRNLNARGGRDGRTRTSTAAQGGLGARRESESPEPAAGDEASSEAAA